MIIIFAVAILMVIAIVLPDVKGKHRRNHQKGRFDKYFAHKE
jgi:hypothetical protein